MDVDCDRLRGQSHQLSPTPSITLAQFGGHGEFPGVQRQRGVGPAESTGKSLVRYWPGGSRWLLSRLRPPKPLVKMPIGDLPFGQLGRT